MLENLYFLAETHWGKKLWICFSTDSLNFLGIARRKNYLIALGRVGYFKRNIRNTVKKAVPESFFFFHRGKSAEKLFHRSDFILTRLLEAASSFGLLTLETRIISRSILIRPGHFRRKPKKLRLLSKRR